MTKRKNPEDKLKMGAPAFPYTKEMAEDICDKVSKSTKRIKLVCKENPHFPSETVIYEWIFKYPDFAVKYREAKARQQDVLVDSQDDELDWAKNQTYTDLHGNSKIDSAAVALAKLKCDNIKWAAARLAPKTYSDKPQNAEQAPATQADIEKVRSDIASLMKKNEKEY